LPEVRRARMQVNDDAAARDDAAVLFGEHHAAAGGKHGVLEFAELGDHLPLPHPETRFALDVEDHGYAHAAAALDFLVGIVEAALQALREQASHGGLACAHHADKDESALGFHGVTILRRWINVAAEKKTAGRARPFDGVEDCVSGRSDARS